MLSVLYAMTPFLCTGGHFVRLIVAVDLAMAKFVVTPEDPLAGVAAAHDQIKEYLMVLYMETEHSEKARAQYAELSSSYFRLFDSMPGFELFRRYSKGFCVGLHARCTEQCKMVDVDFLLFSAWQPERKFEVAH